jgi:mannan endo-1,4-beta-mannosidase
MDEFVNFLVSRYGHANDPNGVKFYDLDNEPALWYQDDTEPPITHATHWEVHPYRPTCVEVRDKSIALSTAVKSVDPNAQILGPVLYGFGAYKDFQGASDWGTQGAGYNWFISYYLDKMEAASSSKRLLDVLDVHWYPEAQDGANHRITDSSINTTAMYNARMQAPRSLWDYDYHEISWIEQWNGQWLPILPPLQSSIDTYFHDTNLAITEYDYGGKDHYSGGIAITDVLGIFGKYGVYISNYWGNSGTYLNAAFKIYRNYDGANSKFGDTEVYATDTNKVESSMPRCSMAIPASFT